MRILIIEDDYFAAQTLASDIRSNGDSVVGPFADSDLAMPHVEDIDAAILDICLGEQPSYRVADALAQRGVPFLFLSSYEQGVLPERLQHVRFVSKPSSAEQLMAALPPRKLAPDAVIDRSNLPMEAILAELLDEARATLPDNAAAERLVATVLETAIRWASSRSHDISVEVWLQRLFRDEINARSNRHLN